MILAADLIFDRVWHIFSGPGFPSILFYIIMPYIFSLIHPDFGTNRLFQEFFYWFYWQSSHELGFLSSNQRKLIWLRLKYTTKRCSSWASGDSDIWLLTDHWIYTENKPVSESTKQTDKCGCKVLDLDSMKFQGVLRSKGLDISGTKMVVKGGTKWWLLSKQRKIYRQSDEEMWPDLLQVWYGYDRHTSKIQPELWSIKAYEMVLANMHIV